MTAARGMRYGIVCVWLLAGACSSSAPKQEQPPSGEPAKPSTAPVQPSASTPAEGEGEYQTIKARTMKGDRADIAIKAPPGWRVMAAPTSPDPHGGKFTLAQATKGLPKQGTLAARIKTSQGSFYCDLFDDKAPNTVANFVGLARGLRKFWDADKLEWLGEPYYDGTTFHRIVPGFMIQGGDRAGTGMGMLGYFIPDELHPSLSHDRPGQLCQANRVKNSNGSQFFITEAPAPHLDVSYSVFGQCEPLTLVQRISRMPQSKPMTPATPVVIEKVEIKRLVGGAAKWTPREEAPPPLPGVAVPGRAVMVPPSKQ